MIRREEVADHPADRRQRHPSLLARFGPFDGGFFIALAANFFAHSAL